MSPSKLREKVITERTEWIDNMVAGVKRLQLGSYEEFIENPVTVAAAESYLRRALEALLDMGRHILKICRILQFSILTTCLNNS
jgi:uncharacterized protein YutE (UPF0331/DUF86 family)